MDNLGAEPATIAGIEPLFERVVGFAVRFAGVALFVMLLVGGINYITAGSDAGKAQTAQKTITWAIGGLVLIAVSYLILRLVSLFTGVEGILNFTITQ